MTFWERVRAVLGREKRDIGQAVREFEEQANRALDEREREQRATPQEKLAIQQARAAEADAAFDEVRRRIEGGAGS